MALYKHHAMQRQDTHLDEALDLPVLSLGAEVGSVQHGFARQVKLAHRFTHVDPRRVTQRNKRVL